MFTFRLEIIANQDISQLHLSSNIKDFNVFNTKFLIFDGVTELTSYEMLADKTFKIYPLSPAFVATEEDIRLSLSAIAEWVGFCQGVVVSLEPENIVDDTREILDIETSQIAARFRVNGDLITNATWSATTGLITFEPRPEAVVSFNAYLHWIRFLQGFMSAILNHNVV